MTAQKAMAQAQNRCCFISLVSPLPFSGFFS